MKGEYEVAILKFRLMKRGAKDLLKSEGVSDFGEFWGRRIDPLLERISEAEQKLKRAKEEEAERRREEKEKKAEAAMFF